MVKAIENLPTFREFGRPDLRDLESQLRRVPVPEIKQAISTENAVTLLEFHMGFLEPEMRYIPRTCPLGTINILRSNLAHIVDKRRDARERYVLLALDTFENPYEIGETPYDDRWVRFLFIGTYQQKRQMLVVVAPWEGKVLWNFMHSDAKNLNKHLQGNLLYLKH